MLLTLSLLLPRSLSRVLLSLVPNQLHVVVYSELLEIDVDHHARRYPSSHLAHRYILLEVLPLPILLGGFHLFEIRVALCGLRISPLLPLPQPDPGQLLRYALLRLLWHLHLSHDPGGLARLDPLAVQVLRKAGEFPLKSARVSLILGQLLLDEELHLVHALPQLQVKRA